jgi:hypothetical protein
MAALVFLLHSNPRQLPDFPSVSALFFLPPVIQRFALTHEDHIADLPLCIILQGEVA